MTDPNIFRFRLFVADETLNSGRAVSNLRAICHQYLPGRHEIELIDVFKDPDRALQDRIFLTPTLVKLSPTPVGRIVGNLSQTELVLQALGLEELAT